SVYLSPAPLYHSAPLHFNIRFQRLGATCVIMEKFDALAALRLIEAHRVTHSQWVPTMFIRLLGLPEEDRARFDLASHRCAIHAAAPCPVQIKKRMIDWWGPILAEYYGATERNGMTVIQADEWLARPGSVGRAVMGRIHILDEDGTELPPGEAGTVYFEGGGAFEYLNDPDKTRDAFDSHGWSTVGDMGYVDADGYLFLTDRKAHMIISGGVNIYPQETENLLAAHPRVADVAVIGVPNAEFGEEVKAVVQLLDPAEAGPNMARALIAHCARHLSKIKCPRSVDFVDELPRHPTGKLYKRLLRDRYWQGRDSRIV
ncbi:MAG: AMP-binding protein, partial [Alphaproteobacteria bacterium]|nr:AMP-binding protein [Alphaproteobacteria bacterium]